MNKLRPDWVRIEIPGAYPALRWVNAICGITNYTPRETGSRCTEIGMADSYVLALSSQPGFCYTYGYEAGKPECLNLSSKSYQANHLTLHGLWPNQDVCGQHYGFCGINPQLNHCDYSPLELTSDVAFELKKLMPSFQYGSCLERHEWNKHGSCQILSPDNYFNLAMRLTIEVNESKFGKYITQYKGEKVQLVTLHELINKSFGKSNAGKVSLGCKHGILVDVFIQLPSLIPLNESLTSLINKAPVSATRDACPKNVTISDFNKKSWF